MAFSPAFTATQVKGYPSQIVITDTSSGSDSNITSRRVYLKTKDNTFLVPSGTSTQYIVWSYANASITIDCLDKDYALYVTVEWLDVSNNILYDVISLLGFTLYNETFDYTTSQLMVANPNLINDNDYITNKGFLRTYIDAGNQALTFASDQYTAQICYDLGTTLRVNSQYYFNSNA